jgi:hypothetical protein
MKTKKEYLENYASNPELARKTLNAGGLTWKKINERKWEVYDPSTGVVPGMIYYADTVKFAKKNESEILEQLREFESECGQLDMPRYSDCTKHYYNWLAWFAWENTMSEILNYLED